MIDANDHLGSAEIDRSAKRRSLRHPRACSRDLPAAGSQLGHRMLHRGRVREAGGNLRQNRWLLLFREASPRRYTIVLEREPDGGYVVSVPALPGCVSQGDTRAEALANIREAIELYLEDCREAGDPVPSEAGKEFVEVEAA